MCSEITALGAFTHRRQLARPMVGCLNPPFGGARRDGEGTDGAWNILRPVYGPQERAAYRAEDSMPEEARRQERKEGGVI
ncbi:hypothetical protein SAMN05660836_02702 [Thermodesulforhabdus norvegica]|uniref:Uncharacterized protein n=1 Tax=Thermodesulforhabdus norvegica TaxID=39841 RepID=A0A1I4WDP0_9BACT|nr:hypothetical protein SAMN05660836_02702 [Thermodesulforhabdus norvegica]